MRCLLLGFCLVALCAAHRHLFPPKNVGEAVRARRDRDRSLAWLLRRLAAEHFDNCTLSIVYDANYEESRPVEFKLYFRGLNLAVVQESVDFSGGSRPKERSKDKCVNYIIFLYNILAMKHIMGQEMRSKVVIVSAESPWEVKDFLKSHASRAYVHLLVITHSMSQRNGDGSYLLYTHKLYAEGSGSTQPLLIGSWIKDRLTFEGVDLFPEKLSRGFMGHRLLVSAIENPPYVVRRSILGSDESNWDGLEVRLMRLAGDYLNFSVEFTEPRSNGISFVESVKSDVALGITSAAVGGIYYTADLLESFDATTPHAEDCASFISLASTALPKYRAILGPFQLSVWLLLCAAYFLLVVPLTFNSKYPILSLLKHPSGLSNMFWFVFSTYTNSFVVANPLLSHGIAKNSITLLLGIYWIFTIIVTACYTGSIVAFITLPVYPSAIETAMELQTYRYRIGTLDHGGWEKWFNVSETDDPFLKQLFRKIEYVPSVLEGVQNASRAYFWPYAFLASKTTLDYIIQTNFAPSWSTKRTLMHISDECFVRYNVVQLFPAKSLYTRSVSQFISRATETGLMDQIVNDIAWKIQRTAIMTNKQITKKISRKIQIEDRVLTVEDTQGMFLLLGSGILMAFFALGLEIIINFLKNYQVEKNKDTQEITIAVSRKISFVGDSWIIHNDTFSAVRHRPSRGSV